MSVINRQRAIMAILDSGEWMPFAQVCGTLADEFGTAAVSATVLALRDAGRIEMSGEPSGDGSLSVRRAPPAYVKQLETERDEWRRRAEAAERRLSNRTYQTF